MEDQRFAELLRWLCTRELTDSPFPVLHLGARHSKLRDGDTVEYRSLVTATGVTESTALEPLGMAVGDSESGEFWAEVLLALKVRGLTGTRVVASGEHGGLREAIAAVLPDVEFHHADTLEELAEDAPALFDLRFEPVLRGSIGR